MPFSARFKSLVSSLFLCFFLLFAAPLFANGKFIAEPAAPDPSIPRQSMIAACRDGIETLIVESTMAADKGERFAWIIPLPAVPEAMEEADPGIMLTMRQILAPELLDARTTPSGLLVAILAVLTALYSAYCISARQGRKALWAFAAFLLAIFMITITLPNYLASGMRGVAGLPEIESSATVGNYDVTLLRAAEADEIGRWLEANAFQPLDESAREAVRQYVEDQWVFAAASLRREGREPLTPHPLKFTFPAEAPVFPMRLSAEPGQTTEVSLYVIGDTPYRCEGFDTILSDRFVADSWKRERWNPTEPAESAVAEGQAFRRTIGDTDIVALIGQEAWVTALRGDLDEAAMRADIYPAAHRDPEPRRKTLSTRPSALNMSIGLGVVLFASSVLIASLAIRGRRRFLVAAVALGVMAALVGAGLFIATPKVEAVRHPMVQRFPDDPSGDLAEELRAANSAEDKRASLMQYMTRYLKEGDGPMQYTIAENGDQLTVRARDRIGRIYTMTVDLSE